MANTKVTSGVIKDDAVGADQLASNAVVTASVVDNAITTAKIADANVLTAKISDSAITNAKMSANSVDSDQYVDGSIDTAHIGDAQVTSAKLETNVAVAGTLTVGSHLNMGDGDILKMGASADLQIYHDGSNSFIKDTGTGNLLVQATHLVLENAAGNQNYLQGVDGGAVSLYYSGSSKLATASGGVTVTGVVTASSLDISGNIDVDGITNLDVVDIDGAVDMASTLAVGGLTTLKTDGNGFALKIVENSGSEHYQIGTDSFGGLVFYNETTKVLALNDAGGLDTFGNVIFNEDSADVDFRVESNGNTHMLFVDGGNNAVGIGRAAPASIFEVHMATNKNIGFSGGQGELGSVPALVAYADNGGLADIGFRGTTLRFATAAAERARIDSSGKIGINTSSPNSMLEVSFADNASTQRWSYASSRTNFYLELDTFIPSSGVVAYSFDLKNNGTAYNNNLVLDRGNVGIGLTNPASTLDVKSPSGSNKSVIITRSSGAEAVNLAEMLSHNALQIFNKASGSYLNFAGNATHTAIQAQSNGSTAEDIALNPYGGNVLIGTTTKTPNYAGGMRVHSASSIGNIRVSAGSKTGFDMMADSGGTGYLIVRDNAGMTFHTNNVEKMKLLTTGELHVTSGGAPISPTFKHEGATGAVAKIRAINRSGQAANKGGVLELGGIVDDGVSRSDVFGAVAGLKTNSNSNNKEGYLALYTTNNSALNEQMRIDSSGNATFGKNEAAVATAGFTIGSPSAGVTSSMPSGNTYHVYKTGSSSGYKFYVSNLGIIHSTQTTINGLSDERLKENIADLETGLSEVMALKPRRFDWKNGDGKNLAGFIAQEVETVLPDLIADFKHEELKDCKSLKMGDMIPTLVKAIQELTTKVKELEDKLNG